jgi:hypothetical protein
MARITCSYSGVVFNCEHMPTSLGSHEYHHPLFSVPQKKLLTLVKEWAANKLSPTESYLLYLALLHSTDLIIWRTSARFTDKTLQIIGNNMEHLAQMVGKINLIKHPSFVLPKMAITYDTGDLGTTFYWIQNWHANYREWMDDFIDARKREEIKEKVERREHSLERLIKTPQADSTKVAGILSEWAAMTGDFPESLTQHPFKKIKNQPIDLTISDYWQEIITACVNESRVWQYPKQDIEELIEHCEENIEHGTIHAHALMKLLRNGLKKRTDYMGFGDIDLAGKTTQFKLLDASASVEDANLIAAIQSAPEKEPKRENYPSAGAYLRAKLNWDMKLRSEK